MKKEIIYIKFLKYTITEYIIGTAIMAAINKKFILKRKTKIIMKVAIIHAIMIIICLNKSWNH